MVRFVSLVVASVIWLAAPSSASAELTERQFWRVVRVEMLESIKLIEDTCTTKRCAGLVFKELQAEFERLARTEVPSLAKKFEAMTTEEAEAAGERWASKAFPLKERKKVYRRLRRWTTRVCIDCTAAARESRPFSRWGYDSLVGN